MKKNFDPNFNSIKNCQPIYKEEKVISTKSNIIMKNVDLNILPENLRIVYEESFKSKKDYVEAKLLLVELLRVKSKTRKEYMIHCTKSSKSWDSLYKQQLLRNKYNITSRHYYV